MLSITYWIHKASVLNHLALFLINSTHHCSTSKSWPFSQEQGKLTHTACTVYPQYLWMDLFLNTPQILILWMWRTTKRTSWMWSEACGLSGLQKASWKTLKGIFGFQLKLEVPLGGLRRHGGTTHLPHLQKPSRMQLPVVSRRSSVALRCRLVIHTESNPHIIGADLYFYYT